MCVSCVFLNSCSVHVFCKEGGRLPESRAFLSFLVLLRFFVHVCVLCVSKQLFCARVFVTRGLDCPKVSGSNHFRRRVPRVLCDSSVFLQKVL
eukprot:SAG11_NODE_15855_length_564_cov_1.215054_2_plen_92_part_01